MVTFRSGLIISMLVDLFTSPMGNRDVTATEILSVPILLDYSPDHNTFFTLVEVIQIQKYDCLWVFFLNFSAIYAQIRVTKIF